MLSQIIYLNNTEDTRYPCLTPPEAPAGSPTLKHLLKALLQAGPLTNGAFIATASTPIGSVSACYAIKRSPYIIQRRGQRISIVTNTPHCPPHGWLITCFFSFAAQLCEGEGAHSGWGGACCQFQANSCVCRLRRMPRNYSVTFKADNKTHANSKQPQTLRGGGSRRTAETL